MTTYYTTHNDEAVDAAYDEWNERTRGGAESWSFAMLDAFRAGARAATEWVSVETAYPPFNTEVLIAFGDCTLPATGQLTIMVGGPGETEWLYPRENHGDGCDWTVTHWMPLPITPAEALGAPSLSQADSPSNEKGEGA